MPRRIGTVAHRQPHDKVAAYGAASAGRLLPLQRVEFGLSLLAKELESRSRSKGEAVALPPRARRDEEIGFNGKPEGSTQAQPAVAPPEAGRNAGTNPPKGPASAELRRRLEDSPRPHIRAALWELHQWVGPFLTQLTSRGISLRPPTSNLGNDVLELGIAPYLDACEGGSDSLRKWAIRDLVRLLDGLALLQSELAIEAQAGTPGCSELAADVARVVHDVLGDASQREGWFVLERVEPFVTRFDPNLHRSVGSQSFPGHIGKIAMVRRLGWRTLASRPRQTLAEVVVAQ